jgi:hypothetical protein
MKPVRSRWLVLATTFVLTLLATVSSSRQADAGVLKVRDDIHALSADDIGRLRHIVDGEPFDARLLVTGDSSSQEDLSRVVGSLVSEPDMVVVGLDPRHHRVQVHFGEQSGIPQAAWAGIERAGNDAFRQGDWAAGVAAILQTAATRVQTPGAPGAAAGRPSLLGPGLLLLALAGIIGAALLFSRRRAMGNAYDSRYGQPGYGGGSYGPPGGGGGMGPLGGGLIGAGLGGLAGYELGKMEGEREERGRDGGANDDGGNYDAGGGGSGWDDGGSGGGGDFGGGDGGGGGSDF